MHAALKFNYPVVVMQRPCDKKKNYVVCNILSILLLGSLLSLFIVTSRREVQMQTRGKTTSLRHSVTIKLFYF